MGAPRVFVVLGAGEKADSSCEVKEFEVDVDGLHRVLVDVVASRYGQRMSIGCHGKLIR